MKFEDLLPEGKKLHELSDEEVDEIISKCSRDELARMETETRKSSRKTKSKRSVASEQKKLDALNAILLKGSA